MPVNCGGIGKKYIGHDGSIIWYAAVLVARIAIVRFWYWVRIVL